MVRAHGNTSRRPRQDRERTESTGYRRPNFPIQAKPPAKTRNSVKRPACPARANLLLSRLASTRRCSGGKVPGGFPGSALLMTSDQTWLAFGTWPNKSSQEVRDLSGYTPGLWRILCVQFRRRNGSIYLVFDVMGPCRVLSLHRDPESA